MVYPEAVFTTLSQSGIDLGAVVIIGGSAMAIHNIRRATDLDLIVHPDIFHELGKAGQTPTGQPLRWKTAGFDGQRLVSTSGSVELPLDLNNTTHYGRVASFLLLAREANTHIMPDGQTVKALTLDQLCETKWPSYRYKDYRDRLHIKQHARHCGVLSCHLAVETVEQTA
jgi:hypothetical protein